MREIVPYCVAFDPGLTATGWALFTVGEINSTGTIRPAGVARQDKLFDLTSKLEKLFVDWKSRFNSKAEVIAIEEWGGHSPSNRFQTMIACAEARGVLVAMCFQYSRKLKYISKGKTPKTEAAWLADRLGLRGSEHSRDAAHLGLLAGFLERI
jgi:Holliday junction resolvasome RuvABC endonuclease subunit